MRVIALEEHFLFDDLVERIPAPARLARGFPPGRGFGPDKQLGNLESGRIEDMDRAGISMQILSCFGPGPELLEGSEAVSLAREMNDRLAGAVAKRPDRFGGFVHLPLQNVEDAAEEFRRGVRDLGFCGAIVNGMTPAFVPAHDNLSIRLWVNGALKQEGVTRDMIFGFEDQIAYAATMMTLEPGDIFSTGTPAGTGQERLEFLKEGDVVEVEVEFCGRQRNRVVAVDPQYRA